ncbi:unnamed protein product [Amoebophrya sp. A25]|nr:unnamed protein product [Amoebophrya sp. A25]|eukprot:GSA25T00013031001.1
MALPTDEGAELVKMAGYVLVGFKSLPEGSDSDASFAALVDEQLKADIKTADGGQCLFAGKPYGVYETACTGPPHCCVFKFASKEAATGFVTSNGKLTDQTFLSHVDMRCFEGPEDLFSEGPGNAYWCAWIGDVVDVEKLMEYVGPSMKASDAGYPCVQDDGSVEKMTWAIKHLGVSDGYGKTREIVPAKGEGKVFIMPHATTDNACVAVLGLGKTGKRVRETTEYKNTLIAPYGVEYTTEEEYEKLTQKFMDEVLKRDLRIIVL